MTNCFLLAAVVYPTFAYGGDIVLEPYAEVAIGRSSYEAVDASLVGGLIGLEGHAVGMKSTIAAEIKHTSSASEQLGLYSIEFAFRPTIVSGNRLRGRAQIDLGYSNVKLERFRNSNDLLSLGGGLLVDFRIADSLLFGVGIHGRFYADGTAPTTCNDGSTSQSTGQGTCSHHNGVRFSNELIGNGFGIEVTAGLRVPFTTTK